MELSVKFVDFLLKILSEILKSSLYFLTSMNIWEFLSQSLHNHFEVFLDEICANYEAVFRAEIFRQMKLFEGPDEPFCRIKMIPRYTVSVVVWEGMMIVVIPLSESEKCEDEIIDSRELFCVGL